MLVIAIGLFSADAVPEQEEPTSRQRDGVYALEKAGEDVETPLTRLEHALHPWAAFFIMPLFALANAGVVLSGDMLGVAFGFAVTWVSSQAWCSASSSA